MTPLQFDTIKAYCDTGTQKAAADALGISVRQVKRRMQAMRDAHWATNMQLARKLGRWEAYELTR